MRASDFAADSKFWSDVWRLEAARKRSSVTMPADAKLSGREIKMTGSVRLEAKSSVAGKTAVRIASMSTVRNGSATLHRELEGRIGTMPLLNKIRELESLGLVGNPRRTGFRSTYPIDVPLQPAARISGDSAQKRWF